MKRSSLFEVQTRQRAQMADFAGWEMPLIFSSVRTENAAVRGQAGLFDISHLGRVELRGRRAAELVDTLTTARATTLAPDRCAYGLMLNQAGGILDDLIFLRLDDDCVLLIINAATRAADLRWMRYHAVQNGVNVVDVTETQFSVALQGPTAQAVLQKVCTDDLGALRRMRWMKTHVADRPVLLSRTGYTGEDGFEIIGTAEDGAVVWTAILGIGEEHGVLPCGLAARDLCRLEAGNRLMGQDMDASSSPLEVKLNWAVDSTNTAFIGYDALGEERTHGIGRCWCGFVLEGHILPRHSQSIWRDGKPVGSVTSGNYSFLLDRPIGAGFIDGSDVSPGTEMGIEVHGHLQPARVVELPFIRRGKVTT